MQLYEIIPTTTGNPDEDTINAFMNTIVSATGDYFSNLIDQERLGSPNIKDMRITATLLMSYINMLILYFSNGLFDDDGRFVTEYNLCTVAEIKDVILKINLICDTSIFIHLEEAE